MEDDLTMLWALNFEVVSFPFQTYCNNFQSDIGNVETCNTCVPNCQPQRLSSLKLPHVISDPHVDPKRGTMMIHTKFTLAVVTLSNEKLVMPPHFFPPNLMFNSTTNTWDTGGWALNQGSGCICSSRTLTPLIWLAEKYSQSCHLQQVTC